jgi:hypothetical protein
MISKKIFTGGINGDDADVLIQPTEYLNALNARFATTENGKVGEISNVEGNVLKAQTINAQGQKVSWTLPAGVNTTIGAIEDTPNKRIFFFNKNSNGSHGIYCYDADTDLVYNVLLSTQVVGGLGFISNINSVSIIGSMLYWTDGVNPQRRINVEAAMRLNQPAYNGGFDPYVLDKNSTGGTGTTHMAQSVINLIRNQPWCPSKIEKKIDLDYKSNLIKNEAFQFAYRFVYRDYETSTFSPLSDLANFNTVKENDDKVNYIKVSLPVEQKIEQDVIKIELAARFVVGGKYFIIKTFSNPLDFATHNTSTQANTPLVFNFYNDTAGYAVDDASAFKQYDSIPLTSGTLEIAKNRLFLGNNSDGYDDPKSTSLTASPVLASNNTASGDWYIAAYISNLQQPGQVYFLYIPYIQNPGFYTTTPYTTTTPGAGSVNFNTLTFVASTQAGMENYVRNTVSPGSYIAYSNAVSTVSVTNAPQYAGIVGRRVFKSDSVYRVGIVFYDEAGRKCGVVTSEALKVTTADRPYDVTEYTSQIRWLLSNVDALVEIPIWATHYSVVLTKSLRTSFFMQFKADDIKWVTKKTDGTYNIETTWAADRYGVAIDVKSLFGVGYGYQYQEGDLMKVYSASAAAGSTIAIKDTYGSYIICDNANLSLPLIYEIYTPYIQSANEPYYERAQTFLVSNPGTSQRSYSTVEGTFNGDVTIINRGTVNTPVLMEAMSPSDANWKIWNTDAGRPNIILDTDLVNKKTNVCFSNVILLGSQTNGLSTFDVLDQTQLPYELASIQRLVLVSKVIAEGTVMLAIGEQETASMYLGESQIVDNRGGSFLATSSGVIGTVNVLRGSYGTINPESVVKYMGNVYWFDANRGAVVSYSQNGLFPISSNKMDKYFRKVGSDIFDNKLSIYGGVDPYHNEILMFAPRRSAIPEGPRLTDMVGSSNTYSFTTQVASSTISVVGSATYTYSGGQAGPNQSVVTGSTGPVTYTYVGTGGTAYGPSAVRPSLVGTYSVTATVASDGIYQAATSAPFAFAIQQAFVFDADYMLLTYQFTDGLDLDTRTRIVTPDVGQDTQPEYVGWGVASVWPAAGTPLLDWGGDNTGTGFESVLINVAQLKASYPNASTLVVDLRAFWYNTQGFNPVNVAATLWKGGTPIKQGAGGNPAYSYTNPTATATLNIASVGKQITLAPTTNKQQSSGERVATLTYSLSTNTGSFNINDTTTPSV